MNVELTSNNLSYKQIVDNLFTTISTNTNTLFIVGFSLMCFSCLLFGFACYHKRRLNLRKLNGNEKNGGLLNLGKNLDSVGFHRYNELVLNSDEENLTGSTNKNKTTSSANTRNNYKFANTNHYSKMDSADNKKLLFTDDDEENDDGDDKIFVR